MHAPARYVKYPVNGKEETEQCTNKEDAVTVRDQNQLVIGNEKNSLRREIN